MIPLYLLKFVAVLFFEKPEKLKLLIFGKSHSNPWLNIASNLWNNVKTLRLELSYLLPWNWSHKLVRQATKSKAAPNEQTSRIILKSSVSEISYNQSRVKPGDVLKFFTLEIHQLPFLVIKSRRKTASTRDFYSTSPVNYLRCHQSIRISSSITSIIWLWCLTSSACRLHSGLINTKGIIGFVQKEKFVSESMQ